MMRPSQHLGSKLLNGYWVVCGSVCQKKTHTYDHIFMVYMFKYVHNNCICIYIYIQLYSKAFILYIYRGIDLDDLDR